MPEAPAWHALLRTALALIDEVSVVAGRPIEWSFGGGTVLMIRLNHRRSKDIDIFISDPQLLGLFTPRLSDAAMRLTQDYDESSAHVKLFLEAGEIDVVVAAPLTSSPYEPMKILGRTIACERPAEIIAKKMWHRGDRATARDLFDLVAVHELEPNSLDAAGPFLDRHAEEFLHVIRQRERILRAEFEALDTLAFTMSFSQCARIAARILTPYLR